MIDFELEAAKRAQKYAKDGEKIGKEYKNLCKSFPSVIVSNGLAQTIAFYEAKGRKEHLKVIENVKSELAEFQKKNNLKIEEKGDLSDKLFNMDLPTYMKFEEYLLNTLKWLRRYVDIYIEGK